MVRDAVLLEQKNGHRFLALYNEPQKARGAIIIAHADFGSRSPSG
ncbi:MAG: hypothetical protein ABI612_17025 [Betaproteobacteria bacterium]